MHDRVRPGPDLGPAGASSLWLPLVCNGNEKSDGQRKASS